jgi:hypothetical protein
MKRDMTRRALLASGGVMVAGGAWLLAPRLRRNADEREKELSAAHGIVLAHGDPSTFYVPPYLAQDARIAGLEMDAAHPDALGPALDGIEVSLSLYPPGFVAGLIKAIFIAGRMRMESEPAGGTYGPAWVLLSADVARGAASVELTCLMGVHHELSSFIYQREDLAERWGRALPPGWVFSSTAAAALRDHHRQDPPKTSGFLNAYGATSPENDFNIYAETMMTDTRGLLVLAEQNPLIAHKVRLLRKAYVEVDARMDAILGAMGLPPR